MTWQSELHVGYIYKPVFPVTCLGMEKLRFFGYAISHPLEVL